MPRDIDIVIEKIRALHPDAAIEQLKVKFPGADDDGLWFFRIPSERENIQVESSTGVAPFVVERGGAPAVYGASIDQVVSEVVTAVSRKLAVTLLALWKSGADYHPLRQAA